MPTKHLLIKGKVQGVFYRANAKDVAEELRLTGWVRNTGAGDVEVVASGIAEHLQQFIAWCRIGPSRANVAQVIETEMVEEVFSSFKIIR